MAFLLKRSYLHWMLLLNVLFGIDTFPVRPSRLLLPVFITCLALSYKQLAYALIVCVHRRNRLSVLIERDFSVKSILLIKMFCLVSLWSCATFLISLRKNQFQIATKITVIKTQSGVLVFYI